ncbi:MAG: hypothetical protein Q4F60_01115 [Candidatus Saccharibacteria bacterium]|nr:hypothetical protein [Candidatus Saccharibacteria bacterium]
MVKKKESGEAKKKKVELLPLEKMALEKEKEKVETKKETEKAEPAKGVAEKKETEKVEPAKEVTEKKMDEEEEKVMVTVGDGVLKCGKYKVTLRTEPDEVDDETLRFLVSHPTQEGIEPKPEPINNSAKRAIRRIEMKRYRVLKRWAKIIERLNRQYIIIFYMDNGFWGTYGPSAVVLNYKICARTTWKPVLRVDNDNFSKISDGKIMVKAIDSLLQTINGSFFIEEKVIQTNDVIVFRLKNKISEKEYRGYLERRGEAIQALESVANDVRTMPKLKMKLIETHEKVFFLSNRQTSVKNATRITSRMLDDLEEAIRELYIILKTNAEAREGLRRIKRCIIRAQAQMVMIGQMRIWDEDKFADVGFYLADCMKQLVLEEKKLESESVGDLEMEIRVGALQKDG